MATARSFQELLNEYLPERLLKEELVKRDWLLNKVDKPDGWKGGDLIVPFQKQRASSVSFGSLTAENDIAEADYIRGKESQKEAFLSLKFNWRDLQEHDGKIPETTFLRILPDQLEDSMSLFKERLSTQMLGRPYIAVAAANGTDAGVLEVDRIERFEVDMKIEVSDGTAYYVTSVDLNASTITLSATRGGAGADLSTGALQIDADDELFEPGVNDTGAPANAFNNLVTMLLPASAGGSAAIHGVTKLDAPITQAIAINGGSGGLAISASNILDKLFEAYTIVRRKSRGNARHIVMSYKHLGSVMQAIEEQKGPFKVSAGDRKASLYGWTEIELHTVKGSLTIVGVQEMSDTEILYLDMKTLKFHTNGMFKKIKSPDGLEYYTVRATSGYSYICDVACFGNLVCNKPSSNAVIYGISY